jgi:hypothetical protein
LESSQSHDEQNRGASIDFLRDYHTSIITACGFLIAIPLLVLSFLATSSAISKSALETVAFVSISSAIAFAVTIHFISQSNYWGGRAFSSKPEDRQAKIDSASKALWRGRVAFEAGLVLLIITMIAVAFALIS